MIILLLKQLVKKALHDAFFLLYNWLGGSMKNKNVNHILIILLIVLPIFMMDYYARNLYYSELYSGLSPFLFTLSYSLLIVLIFISLSKKHRKIFYIFEVVFTSILFLSQTIHYKVLDSFYTFSDIFLAKEGSSYINYVIKFLDYKIILFILLTTIICILNIYYINRTEFKFKYKNDIIIMLVICFVGFRLSGYFWLQGDTQVGDFASFKYPKTVYDDYNNSTLVLKVSGLYEQFFRGIYVYAKDSLNINRDEQIEIVDNYFKNIEDKNIKNEYTGKLKDKNVIFIMLESIDSFLINDTIMPNLNELKNNGLNFTRRYAPYFQNGQTINSEFASITGLFTTTTGKSIFSYNNDYPYSIANVLKENGYTVNSMHMNNGVYYNRKVFHENLGFTNHYALKDMDSTIDFESDSNILKYYDLIKSSDKFFTFITTYSVHLPYVNNELCKRLETSDNLRGENSEITCLNTLAHETDKFIGGLVDKLKEDNLLDDTVLVLFADHNIYGYSNMDELKKIKNLENPLASPFIIYNKELEHKDIDNVSMTIDIVPTVLNLLGLGNQNNYLGTDIFNENRVNLSYFLEQNWYDGETYYDGKINNEYTNLINKKIDNMIKVNDSIIKSNYYKNN